MNVAFRDLLPSAGEHTFICGMTGAGKTTVAKEILRHIAHERPVLIFDPKNDFDYSGICRPDELCIVGEGANLSESRYWIYRPGIESDIIAETNALCHQVLYQGNVTVFFDELSAHVGADKVGVLYRLGRSKGVTIIGCSQRPKNIPLDCIEQCRNIFSFNISLTDDVKRMKSYFSEEIMDKFPLNSLKMFYFLFRSNTLDGKYTEEPIKMNIRGNR